MEDKLTNSSKPEKERNSPNSEPEISAPKREKDREKSASFRDSLKKRFSWKKPKSESPTPPLGGATSAPSLRQEDPPWCSMCTDDAAVRCAGCDGDLYCRKCFKEAHDREDLKTHKWSAYRKKGIETTV